jgi:predicted lipoprotein with Yx(FWY)xxD motif
MANKDGTRAQLPSWRVAWLVLIMVTVVATGCGYPELPRLAGRDADADAPPPPPDAAAPPPPPDAAAPSFTLTTTPATLGERLVDSTGRSLYFFANDIAGTNASACPATLCPAPWIPVDVASPTVGAGLTASDFGHFGNQSTWKGRPLYRFANDTAATPTTGENVAGRWFAARAYNLFFESIGATAPKPVTPLATPAGTAPGAPFFTNGAGRSVYVFKNDTRGTATTPAVNNCTPNASCNALWTPWTKPATVAGPSTVLPTDITSISVTFNGATVQQFVYKGWPLYFYNADVNPGQVAGDSFPSTGPLWHAINVSWDGAAIP